MKKFFAYLALTHFLFQQVGALSPLSLEYNYTLLIKAIDTQKNVCVALVPGNNLVKNEQLLLDQASFAYSEAQWQEICQMWQDYNGPQDVACFFIHPTKYNKKSHVVSCLLPTQSEETTFSFKLDKKLTFQEAVLVINDFVTECFPAQTKPVVVKSKPSNTFDLDSIDIEFDEEEIQEYSRSNPPSGLLVYARQVGVALYFKSVEAINYVGDRWTQLKQIVFGQ